MTLHLPSSRSSCCQLHRATIRAAVKPNVSIYRERFPGELGYVFVLLDRFEKGQEPRDSHEKKGNEPWPPLSTCPQMSTTNSRRDNWE